jgi:hypothetical protein
MKDDTEHLRILSICHYIVGGLAGCCALIPLLYTVLGSVFVVASRHGTVHPGHEPPPEIVGWISIVIGVVFCLVGLAFAAVILWSARSLSRRRSYWFCFIVACVECLFLPFGTVLGLFTLIVLSRESVKTLFLPVPAPPRA